MSAKRRDVDVFLRRLWALESELVKAGFPPLPAWWRETIERFYRSGKRRLVVRKGRRVFASTSVAPRLSVAEMLFGEHPHLPGMPPHIYAFLSVKRDEASKRLRGIKAILDVLAEPYDEKGDTIELRDRPAIFSVVTANYRTSVGESVAFCWCDEVARWRDETSGANPAEEVVGSLAPALSTLPDAKLFLVSSPLTTEDYHARQFDLGETEAQAVAFGETWTINPSMTREMCEREEPDRKRFLREYGAQPSASVSAAFDVNAIEAAFSLTTGNALRGQRVIVLDPSSGRKDAWTWGVVGWDWPAPRSPAILRFDVIDGVSAGFFKGVRAEAVVERVAQLAKVHDVHVVHADQRESLMLESAFSRHGLAYRVHDWTASSKPEAVERVRRWMADGRLSLPEHDTLRRELLAFEEKITPSGSLTFGARGSGHDDYVSLLITAALAIAGDGEARTDWSHARRINDMIVGRDRGLNEPPLPHRDFINLGRWHGYGRGFG